ncbi:MAG: hypothetical protein K2L07_00835 [Lachnospiraceae bacterium]|nr:hypothetical protein [Lachnospiraceae bacterium]
MEKQIQKQTNQFFTSAALLFIMIFSFSVFAAPQTVNAQAYEQVPVNKVEDITTDFSGVGYSVNKSPDFSAKTGPFIDTYYYQFTLDSPSYIMLKEYADCFKYTWNGKIRYYISNSNVFTEGYIIEGFASGSEESYASLYEAGTYSVKVELEFTSSEVNEYNGFSVSPHYAFSIFVQPVARTGMTNGNSLSAAIPLSKGKPVNGALSKQNRKQYFTFKQGSDGAFSTDVVIAAPVNWNMPNVLIELYKETGAKIAKKTLRCKYTGDNSGTLSVKKLPKGNYYILVSTSDEVWDRMHVGTVTLNASYKTVETLSVPKLKSYKAGSKKITGTAVKGAKVTVKVGKKTYTATAKKGKFTVKLKSKLKKGTTIKVKATKSGYKASKTVTYKVKKSK